MNKKILIMDDKTPMRTLMGHILGGLKNQGIELLMAANGEEGLRIALDEHPDLIFLDVQMPYMNGDEVCRRVKAAHRETYVILLTGQAVEDALSTEIEADECIAKPFHPDYILERVSAVLGLES
jgi:two-component system alkaline phosphatase synthesis response regulator PhoP